MAGWLEKVTQDQYNAVAKSLDKMGISTSASLLRLIILASLDPGSPKDFARDLGITEGEVQALLKDNNHIFFAEESSTLSDYHVIARVAQHVWTIEKDLVLDMLKNATLRDGGKVAEHGLSSPQVEQLEQGLKLIRELREKFQHGDQNVVYDTSIVQTLAFAEGLALGENMRESFRKYVLNQFLLKGMKNLNSVEEDLFGSSKKMPTCRLVNVDSSLASTKDLLDLELFALKNIGLLLPEFESTPVYLVSPQLLETIHDKRGGHFKVSLECLQNVMKEIWPEGQNAPYSDFPFPKDYHDFWQRAEETCKEVRSSSEIDVVGVYVPNLPHTIPLIEAAKTINVRIDLDKPAIFISPDKVGRWLNQIFTTNPEFTDRELAFKVLFAKVLYHELSHSYMNGNKNPPNSMIRILVEESLANAISYNRFEKEETEQVAEVEEAIRGQPPEYRACRFWIDYVNEDRTMIAANDWRNFTPDTTWVPRSNTKIFHESLGLYVEKPSIYDLKNARDDATFWEVLGAILYACA